MIGRVVLRCLGKSRAAPVATNKGKMGKVRLGIMGKDIKERREGIRYIPIRLD
jgi:hypothetical protein